MANFIEIEKDGKAILLNCNLINYITPGENSATYLYLVKDNPFNISYLTVPKKYSAVKDDILL